MDMYQRGIIDAARQELRAKKKAAENMRATEGNPEEYKRAVRDFYTHLGGYEAMERLAVDLHYTANAHNFYMMIGGYEIQ
jgi:hypothetical protein